MIKESRVRVDQKGRELEDHGNLSFPCACYHSYPGQADVPWHWHEEIELMYVVRGKVRCAVKERRFLVQEGEALFINSGVPHSFYQEGMESYEEYDIVFHPRLLYGDVGSVFYEKYLSVLIRCGDLSGYVFRGEQEWQREVIRRLRSAVELCGEEREFYESGVREELMHICTELLRRNPDKTCLVRKTSSLWTERAEQMLDYFHQHFQEKVTLDELAAQASLCKRECQRIFRAVLGITPTEYFEQYRLGMAVNRLLATDDTVSEIAQNSGFQSSSYFSKLFRRRYGMTPTQFRNRKRGGERV